MTVNGGDLEALKKALRRAREGAGITLTAVQAGLLLDELGRLSQSAERLRRQNRRARLRLQKGGLEPEATIEDEAPGPDETTAP